MAGNPGTMGSGSVAATLAMVSQVRCTGVSVGVGWNACAGAMGTSYRAGDLRRFRLLKNWPEVPEKVCRVGERRFTRACAHRRLPDRPPLWSLQVAGQWFYSAIGLDRICIGLYH